MRLRVTFDFNIHPDVFEGMTPQEAATLTQNQLDSNKLYIKNIFDLAYDETFTIEVVDN